MSNNWLSFWGFNRLRLWLRKLFHFLLSRLRQFLMRKVRRGIFAWTIRRLIIKVRIITLFIPESSTLSELLHGLEIKRFKFITPFFRFGDSLVRHEFTLKRSSSAFTQ
jgi:hypothetical protein